MANDGPLKLMYLNPVGTPDYDGVFADMARTVKLPGTEVHVMSLKPADGGFTHIEYRSYEAVVSTGIVRAARAAAAEGFDALAIGCFYDTALLDAREVSGDMVVTAPCAASLEIAASLANRFGIIVGRRKWVHQMNATVRDNGMADRLSGFYPVELGVNDFQTDHDVTERRITAAGKKAIDEDFAEAGDRSNRCRATSLPRHGFGMTSSRWLAAKAWSKRPPLPARSREAYVEAAARSPSTRTCISMSSPGRSPSGRS